MARRIDTRFTLMLALVLAALGVWMLGQGSTAITAAQSNFVGGDPSRPDASDIRALRLRFEAGARSNWHSHGGFQLIMAQEGRGRTQVRGEALQEMLPGCPTTRAPGSSTGTARRRTSTWCSSRWSAARVRRTGSSR
jgi:hypothetical protein